ncbi:MAG: aminotransferase class III-fold pyridoxal phosphate-dependent enzyme, partial [Actinomycetota bacterium]|nr:aminotransferase class III-fold pyridoxal phosphate-dependent enzyme [Actinomycetota bacterium]
AALDDALDESVCAVVLEPVQGEGGVWPCTGEYLAAARRLCDERGALLILDEVQTGCFRTGHAFAHHGFEVEPDIMTLAKALANGLPIGAIVARPEVADAFQPGDHGSTFGGGPVVCAAGRATLASLAAEKLGANAEVTGAYLQKGLETLAAHTGAISDVRGLGLMAGVTLTHPVAAEVAATALGRGLLLNNIGADTLRFLPPLVCGTSEVDTLLSTLTAIFEEVSPS